MGKRVSEMELRKKIENSLLFSINKEKIAKARTEISTATILNNTGFFIENEDFRPGLPKGELKIGISQELAWPGLFKARKNLFAAQLKYEEAYEDVIITELTNSINKTYYSLWYLQDMEKLYKSLDSIYFTLSKAAILKVKTGDSPGLDSISAIVRSKEIKALMAQVHTDIFLQQQSLQQFLNNDSLFLPLDIAMPKLPMPQMIALNEHPQISLQNQELEITKAQLPVLKNQQRPTFNGRLFSQRLYGASDPLSGFSVAMHLPLFSGKAAKNKLQVARSEIAIAEKENEYRFSLFTQQKNKWQQEVLKNEVMLQFYEDSGLLQAEEIIKASGMAYRAGEISFADLSQFLTQAIEIKKNYLNALNNYNQSVIELNYYNNFKN